MLGSRHGIHPHLLEEAGYYECGTGREPLGACRCYERMEGDFHLACKERKDPENEMDQRHGSTVSKNGAVTGHSGLQPFGEGGYRWFS